MQLREWNATAAGRLHGRVECNERLREITGVRGNAFAARAEHRVSAIHALECGATRFGHALVAGEATTPEVLAAGALQNIAPKRRHIADLPARGQGKSLLDERESGPHRRMILGVGHAHQRSETQTSLAAVNPPVALR